MVQPAEGGRGTNNNMQSTVPSAGLHRTRAAQKLCLPAKLSDQEIVSDHHLSPVVSLLPQGQCRCAATVGRPQSSTAD